jgi:hypothetical protein
MIIEANINKINYFVDEVLKINMFVLFPKLT